jgi:hypothetical protein
MPRNGLGGPESSPVCVSEHSRLGCGRPLRPGDAWTCDHIVALISGGANRESNTWKPPKAFVVPARQCDGVASSGERVLLHAILHVTDFTWLADELTEGQAWQRMDRVGGDWRRAVAACVGAPEI